MMNQHTIAPTSDWPSFSAILKILSAALALGFFLSGCAQTGASICLTAPDLIYEVQACNSATTEGYACYEAQGDNQCVNPGTNDYVVANCIDTACSTELKVRKARRK